MGPGGAASGRLGQPVAVQLISLVMAGWVITLAVTAAVVLLLPLVMGLVAMLTARITVLRSLARMP